MSAGLYVEPKMDYTQEAIQSMIQSVVTLYFKPFPKPNKDNIYIPERQTVYQQGESVIPERDLYRARRDGLVHTYDGITLAIYPNGIDHGVQDDGYQTQIKWEIHDDWTVANLTEIESQETRTEIGRVLRHLLDSTE